MPVHFIVMQPLLEGPLFIAVDLHICLSVSPITALNATENSCIKLKCDRKVALVTCKSRAHTDSGALVCHTVIDFGAI